MLNSNTWAVERNGTDRYGRTLATIRIDVRDAGEWLVEESSALVARWRGMVVLVAHLGISFGLQRWPI